MPILDVQGIPGDIEKSKLIDIWKSLRLTVADISDLDLKKEQVTVFFPSDLLQDGLGEEIIITIRGLFKKSKRTNKVRNILCREVAIVARAFFPKALVEVLIDPPYNPEKGFWTSAK